MSTIQHYQGDDFPIHIDLGKTPSSDGPVTVNEVSETKSKKPKKYYPSLYISDIKGLGDLPKDGCALIEFHRRSVTVGDHGDSADLEIRAICLQEPSENDGEDLKTALSKVARGMGVDTGQEESEEEDDNEEGEG